MPCLAAACNGTAAPTVPAGTEAVVAVLDGDSLVVDLGGEETEVRLLGINTPERDECFDQEARARAGELAGDRVRLSGEDEDRFGRLLGYAYTEDGTLINQQLVAEGMALALSTNHALLRRLQSRRARRLRPAVGALAARCLWPGRRPRPS